MTGRVLDRHIEQEMREAYLDYAMSVIVSRALPDVRDGMKPVQRRVLYAMSEMNLLPNQAYRKSAGVVGEVLGKYHPHGDAPVYDAMVRLAQPFSMRYPLVDGQGNFGSVDNDPPAAMRYTEARLSPIAMEMLADIDRETVAFIPNYDDRFSEPTVLPARLPNLLVNGTNGIAVGMATSIPPHNLTEVCNATIHLIDNPEATVNDLLQFIKGPDFPTGAIVMGRSGLINAYSTGHGRAIVQARAEVQEMRGNRQQIVVTEIPFQVNKAALVEKIAELARDKKIDGISEIRDESDRQGMRIVIELRREAMGEQVLNALYKHTSLRTAIYYNMLALVEGQPRVLGLRAILSAYIEFRKEIVVKRTQYDLRKARDRAHILEGLKIALDNLDAVITLIRQAESADAARTGLMTTFGLSQRQAQAILDMQLRRLAALERQRILDEYAEILQTISELEALLADPKKIEGVVREEVIELRDKYGDERRTEINDEEARDFTRAELVPHQEVAVTLSQRGYIKRVPASTYRLQRRGGRGIKGMNTREADAVKHLLVCDTHDTLFFFTNRGRVAPLKCYELPADASRTARGLPLVNYISTLTMEDKITAIIYSKSLEGDDNLVFATKLGEVKRTPVRNFANVRSTGIIAMDLEKDDEVVAAKIAQDNDDIILVTEHGQAIRFNVGKLRAASRTSGGVRGITLKKGDQVVAMEVVSQGTHLLALTKNGFGKRTPMDSYPAHGRGGQGVKTFNITDKTGDVCAAVAVTSGQELMMVSRGGVVNRTTVDEISRQGRVTQGVTIMNVEDGDELVSVARIDPEENGSDDSEE